MVPSTTAVEIYLALVIGVGVSVNFLIGRESESSAPQPPRRQWDRADAWALALVIIALGLRLWGLGSLPVSGDEASGLEMGFWSNWFLNHETGSHPPLFRFLIHLTSTRPESLWLMRAPAAVFGSLGTGLLYVAARRWSSGWTAIGLAAVLVFFPTHVIFSMQQKNLTLLICFLLLAHLSLLRALDGSRRSYGFYAIWAVAACMTNYQAPFFLLGHLGFIAFSRRAVLARVGMALIPAFAALAPFVYIEVFGPMDQGSRLASLGLVPNLLNAFHDLSIRLLVLLTAALALAGNRSSTSDGRKVIPWTLALGAVGLVVIALRTPVQARYVLPMVPFALLYAAARSRSPRRRSVYRMVLAAGVLVFFAMSLIDHLSPPQRHQGNLAETAMTIHNRSSSGSRQAILVSPVSMLEVIGFVELRRRDLWNLACPSPTRAFRDQDRVLFHAATDALPRVLAGLGGFDLFRFRIRDDPEAPGLDAWVRVNCRPVEPLARDWTTAVYRCGGRIKPNVDVCKVLAKAHAG
ncbi:MAG: glycosyltransferase family 39 protein [Deltaproteobacteria bacterium]|nr:glycosyltransferase family 39 protein [Deltaproteobacteria bacterium]